MSEVLTGSPAGTIYGTFDDAGVYIDGQLGDAYRAWEALAEADQKRALLTAARYLDQQVWVEEADTFAERDAIAAFQYASYELACMVADDPSIVTVADQGSRISAAGAGGAFVNFAFPTTVQTGSAQLLPPILMRLIGEYLGGGGISTAIGGIGVSDGCTNPLSECADYDFSEPK